MPRVPLKLRSFLPINRNLEIRVNCWNHIIFVKRRHLIKQFRDHFGVSQVELSNMAGLAETAISQIENGRKQPSKRNIEKICKAFDISVALLYVMGMQESDVSASRKYAYDKLYRAMKEFAIQMIGKRNTKIV